MANFSLTLTADQLGKGLRPNERTPRDSKYLVESKGAMSVDGVLSAIESLTRLNTSAITDGFPFPQLFVFTKVIIVCSRTKIYEWNGSSLVTKYTASAGAGMWSAVDYFDYVFLTNGKITVERNPESKVYELSSTLPHGSAACNYNGQLIIGAPDVDQVMELLIAATPIEFTLTPIVEWGT